MMTKRPDLRNMKLLKKGFSQEWIEAHCYVIESLMLKKTKEEDVLKTANTEFFSSVSLLGVWYQEENKSRIYF